MLRKKSEKCIAFLVPSLHCKLALFGVPLSLQPLPSLRSVQWPPLVPLLSLPLFKIKKLEIEPIIYLFCSRDIDQKKIDLLFIDEKDIIPIEIKKEIAPKNPTKNFNVLNKYKHEIKTGLVIDCVKKNFVLLMIYHGVCQFICLDYDFFISFHNSFPPSF